MSNPYSRIRRAKHRKEIIQKRHAKQEQPLADGAHARAALSGESNG